MNTYTLKAITIVTALLALAAPAMAGTAIHNINGYTSTTDGIVSFSVLLIDDQGRVAATGNAELLADNKTLKKVDGGGRTLLPGLIDAHAHVYSLGQLKSQVDLFGTQSLSSALSIIGEFAADNPRADWIQGRGWNQVLWDEQVFPTAANIDTVVEKRPVWLRRVDGHAGWANSEALKRAGITPSTPDPIGGKILRDDNGIATGVLIDKAMSLVSDEIPRPDKDDIQQSLMLADATMISEGITSVHDAGVDSEMAEVYLSLADDGKLNTRIYAMISGADANLDAIGQPIHGYADDRLEISSVKLYSDGALGSRGAAMLEPYTDDAENRGLPFYTQEEMNAFVTKANGMGFQVGIHAIGDKGNRISLNAFEKAQNGKPSPLRNRIEHAQIISEEDLPRFSELGIIASMQSTHATSDKNMAEDRIGPTRILGGYAWRRLLDSGAVISNGSDFPVELSNPFFGLFAAVTRQSRDNQPADGWYPDQAMTRAEALHSFTYDAAYGARQEDVLGSLEKGKWADFIIIDRDYFAVPADQIDDIRVLETWIAGERVYAAGSGNER